jgi:hypothetical protein
VLQAIGVKRVLLIALIAAAAVLLGRYIWQRRRPSKPIASPTAAT